MIVLDSFTWQSYNILSKVENSITPAKDFCYNLANFIRILKSHKTNTNTQKTTTRLSKHFKQKIFSITWIILLLYWL